MPKLALNFICKDEEKVIERMLNSSNGVLDLIVAVDTGSTDRTIELIKKYGTDNNITFTTLL
jgi:glycosyltransferase involved in cell wall biosynthesis